MGNMLFLLGENGQFSWDNGDAVSTTKATILLLLEMPWAAALEEARAPDKDIVSTLSDNAFSHLMHTMTRHSPLPASMEGHVEPLKGRLADRFVPVSEGLLSS